MLQVDIALPDIDELQRYSSLLLAKVREIDGVTEHRSGAHDHSEFLWTALNLCTWRETFRVCPPLDFTSLWALASLDRVTDVPAALAVIVIAASVVNSVRAAPHFRLFTNSIGGGTAWAGSSGSPPRSKNRADAGS